MRIRHFFPALLISAAVGLSGGAQANTINIYTTREPGLIEPLIKAYKEKTGTEVKTVFMKDGLAERVATEGRNSPADVLMAVDFGKLDDLVAKGVTQPVKSAALETAIPANLREANGHWFALSMRGRVAYVAKDLGLKSLKYEDLADPKWTGKLCMRSGQHPYNTALIAAYITHHGAAATDSWLRGIKAALSRKPGGGDRDIARDILGGTCKIGIGNTYYVGLMRSGKAGEEQKQWGDAIDVVMPTFEKGGTHVNVSGAAIAKHAPNRDKAIHFVEFLASDEAQGIYAEANFEYPVKEGVKASPLIEALGPLAVDALPLTGVSGNRKEASELVDKVGFDS